MTSAELRDHFNFLKELYTDETKYPDLQVSFMATHLMVLDQMIEILQRVETLEQRA